jgi:hypothetical protein
MVYEYWVFVDMDNSDTDVFHFSDEKLWEGAVFRANRRGTDLDGLPVLVERVVSHRREARTAR